MGFLTTEDLRGAVIEHHDYLLGAARRHLVGCRGTDPEDLVQDLYLEAAAGGLDSYDPVKLPIEQFLAMRLQSRAYNAINSERVTFRGSDGETVVAPICSLDDSDGYEVDYEKIDLAEDCRQSIAALPENLRDAIELYMQDFTSDEIGAELGITAATARKRIERGKAILRESLSEVALAYGYGLDAGLENAELESAA